MPKYNTGLGDGRFRADIYYGDPVKEAEARIAKERQSISDDTWQLPKVEVKVEERPRLVPSGPAEFSTCQALEQWPAIVWDVNNYYRELGVHWRSSKTEIRKAYQALEGWKSDRLTYIVKQLLDDEKRRGYDATQVGSVWFDKYVAAFVRNQMMEDERKEHGRSLTPEERMKDGGDPFDFEQYLNKPFQVVDKDGGLGQGGEWLDPAADSSRWRWGYYLWRADDYDTGKLRQWQELLIEAASAERRTLKLSLGLMGGSAEPIEIQEVGYRTVVFLGSGEQPTIALARRAVRRVVSPTKELQPYERHSND